MKMKMNKELTNFLLPLLVFALVCGGSFAASVCDGLEPGSLCALPDSVCGTGLCDALGNCTDAPAVCFKQTSDVKVLALCLLFTVGVAFLGGLIALPMWLAARLFSGERSET